LVRELEMTDGR